VPERTGKKGEIVSQYDFDDMAKQFDAIRRMVIQSRGASNAGKERLQNKIFVALDTFFIRYGNPFTLEDDRALQSRAVVLQPQESDAQKHIRIAGRISHIQKSLVLLEKQPHESAIAVKQKLEAELDSLTCQMKSNLS
jgi:hypothetical protein